MLLKPLEQRFGNHADALGDRLRAHWLRLRGAELAPRTRIGPRCVVQRPWCLTTAERVQLEHYVHVKATGDDAAIRLGRDVFVGFNTEFDISHELVIGDNCLIAPGCFITDHTHRYAAGLDIVAQGCEAARVVLGRDVWLGAHAVVLHGVTIGDGAIVAAGAVVVSDVAPMSVVTGVPAKVISHRTGASRAPLETALCPR